MVQERLVQILGTLLSPICRVFLNTMFIGIRGGGAILLADVMYQSNPRTPIPPPSLGKPRGI